MGNVAKVRRLVVMLRGGRQRLLHLAERRIHQLQRAEHVHVPVEEEADLGRAAAGGGAHGHQAGNAVDRVFDRLGDGDLHLLDRHDAVVHADDDARKIGLGKDRDRHLERQRRCRRWSARSGRKRWCCDIAQPEARSCACVGVDGRRQAASSLVVRSFPRRASSRHRPLRWPCRSSPWCLRPAP